MRKPGHGVPGLQERCGSGAGVVQIHCPAVLISTADTVVCVFLRGNPMKIETIENTRQ